MILNKITFQKILIQLRAALITNRTERKHFRKKMMENIIKNAVQKAKWGISYSVFDGEELLEPSLLNIRKEVDYVNVVYSTQSWTGEYQNEGVVEVVQKLKDKGLIDELIEFKVSTKLSPVENEKAKRNKGLRYAKKAGVDYFMTMDVDEFYDKDELEKTKGEIIEKGVTHSYCPIINYGTLPTKVSKVNPAFFAVPLFSKIRWFSRLGPRKKSIALVDPTRNMSHCFGAKYFFFLGIAMHHMSCVRKDLNLKFKASTNSDLHNTKIAEIRKKDLLCVDVEDKFNIMPYLDLNDGENQL